MIYEFCLLAILFVWFLAIILIAHCIGNRLGDHGEDQ